MSPTSGTSAADTINQITQHIQASIQPVAAAAIAVEQVAHSAPQHIKLSAVLNAVQATAFATSAVSPNITVQAIAGLTSLLVAIFNAAGIFNHGEPPNIPAAIPPAAAGTPNAPQPAQ